jgi:hypothetical protein
MASWKFIHLVLFVFPLQKPRLNARISQQTMTGGDLPGFTAAQTETKTERPKVGIQSPLLFIYNLPVQYITRSWKI